MGILNNKLSQLQRVVDRYLGGYNESFKTLAINGDRNLSAINAKDHRVISLAGNIDDVELTLPPFNSLDTYFEGDYHIMMKMVNHSGYVCLIKPDDLDANMMGKMGLTDIDIQGHESTVLLSMSRIGDTHFIALETHLEHYIACQKSDSIYVTIPGSGELLLTDEILPKTDIRRDEGNTLISSPNLWPGLEKLGAKYMLEIDLAITNLTISEDFKGYLYIEDAGGSPLIEIYIFIPIEENKSLYQVHKKVYFTLEHTGAVNMRLESDMSTDADIEMIFNYLFSININ